MSTSSDGAVYNVHDDIHVGFTRSAAENCRIEWEEKEEKRSIC